MLGTADSWDSELPTPLPLFYPLLLPTPLTIGHLIANYVAKDVANYIGHPVANSVGHQWLTP